MLKFKLIGLAVIVKSLLVNTFHPAPEGFERNKGTYQVTTLGRISHFLESSGLEYKKDSLLITHRDGGGGGFLYTVNYQAELKDTTVLDIKNHDWEDITRDDQGHLYIGDFGNNLNKRKRLLIYKYNISTGAMTEIRFSLVDQKAFPPDKKNMNFDIEAMGWRNGKLHLFSKNRGLKCVKHYIVPDVAGEYELHPEESVYLPNMITGADINDNGNLLALSSYGRIFIFDIAADTTFFKNPYKSINFLRGAQMEALTFVNDTDFVVSNETGKLFLFRKKE